MRLHQGGVLTLIPMCGYPKPNTLYSEFVCVCASKYHCTHVVNSHVENQHVRNMTKMLALMCWLKPASSAEKQTLLLLRL